jgi:hypothetical protein
MRVRLAFRELVGDSLASACETIELRGSTLTIATSNPALAHQLRLDSDTLLDQLNGRDLGRRLRALKVRTGRGPAHD